MPLSTLARPPVARLEVWWIQPRRLPSAGHQLATLELYPDRVEALLLLCRQGSFDTRVTCMPLQPCYFSNSQQLLAELTASVKPVTSSPDPFGQVSSTSSMSLPKASESSVESFANFDNAQFEPAPVAFPGRTLSIIFFFSSFLFFSFFLTFFHFIAPGGGRLDSKRMTKPALLTKKLPPPPGFFPPPSLPTPLPPLKANTDSPSYRYSNQLQEVFARAQQGCDQAFNLFPQTPPVSLPSTNPFLFTDVNAVSKPSMRQVRFTNESHHHLSDPFGLAPKNLNNVQLGLNPSTNRESMSMNCLNPFSPNYYPRLTSNVKSPEVTSSDNNNNQASAYRLGQSFFNSLFNASQTNQCRPESVFNRVADPSPAFNTRATPPILATSAVKAPVAKPSAPVTASAPPPVAATKAEDKYAALKDLDDIFRTSVAINDGMLLTSQWKNNVKMHLFSPCTHQLDWTQHLWQFGHTSFRISLWWSGHHVSSERVWRQQPKWCCIWYLTITSLAWTREYEWYQWDQVSSE